MNQIYWVCLFSFLGIAVLFWLFFWPVLRAEVLLRGFRKQRPQLESQFRQIASTSGKPKGLMWKQIDFEPKIHLVRDRNNGQFSALVAVSIEFEPITGGGMENVAAAFEKRSATALFHHSSKNWGTGGRVLFNLEPEQAILTLGKQYELVKVA